MRGVLLDQPHVVANAAAVLERAGVADRCEIVGGSFFDEVPAGGDAYTLKSIIHDYEDARAVTILRICRRAMAADAALLLIERIVGPPNEDPQPSSPTSTCSSRPQGESGRFRSGTLW